jgi:hypothetical protein
LIVVDRNEQRSVSDRDAERPCVDLTAEIVSHEQCRLEGSAARGREFREILGPHVAEKVAEHHVGEEPLAFGWPRGKDDVPVVVGRIESCEPQSRLAYPGGAL